MHHIRTNAKNTQILMNEDVKRLAFLPIMGVPMIILCPVKIKKQLAYQDTEQKTTKKSFNQKLTKHVLQLGALSLLALPVKALLANKALTGKASKDNAPSCKTCLVNF